MMEKFKDSTELLEKFAEVIRDVLYPDYTINSFTLSRRGVRINYTPQTSGMTATYILTFDKLNGVDSAKDLKKKLKKEKEEEDNRQKEIYVLQNRIQNSDDFRQLRELCKGEVIEFNIRKPFA